MHLPPSIASCLTVAFIVFLFRRDIREKPECQRRALASTSLAGARLLKILFRMAQYLRLARERRCFSGRGKSAGCVVLLRPGYSGLLCPY